MSRIPTFLVLPQRQHSTTQLAKKSSWTHPMWVNQNWHLNPVLMFFIYRYTQQQVLAVQTAHRKASSWQDKVALSTVRVLRWGMDFVTGYNSYSPTSNFELKTRPMTEQKWITRFIFLESVAGVPGMVAGMLRHLKSIRMMRRDYGWWVKVNLIKYIHSDLCFTGSKHSSKKPITSECISSHSWS